MFDKLNQWWEDYGLEILVGISIVVILILALTRIGKKGSWTTSLQMPKSLFYKQQLQHPKQRVPRDSKGELECRRVLQQLFQKPFNKARPNFLNNPVTGGHYNLELDCYDPSLRLAVEYNGVQHYKYVPFFHKNKEAFLNQKYRDDMKRRICKERGVILIEVPNTIKVQNIKGFLTQQLRRYGYNI